MIQLCVLAHGTIYKVTCMCQGACCELSPVPTRPHNNVLLALRVIRESFEQGKLSGPLCKS